jgi:hypothetical protein
MASPSQTPHPFIPNPMHGRFKGQSNWAECAHCRMPNTHRVHPQAARGALGHQGLDDYQQCYDEGHWDRPVLNNEGRLAT